MVGEPVTAVSADAGQTVVYARVSSADQLPDLDRQVARVTMWATGQHLAVSRVVTEVGSAVNGHRGKFLALLRDPAVSTIVVEQDRKSTRLNSSHLVISYAVFCLKKKTQDQHGFAADTVRDQSGRRTQTPG